MSRRTRTSRTHHSGPALGYRPSLISSGRGSDIKSCLVPLIAELTSAPGTTQVEFPLGGKRRISYCDVPQVPGSYVRAVRLLLAAVSPPFAFRPRFDGHVSPDFVRNSLRRTRMLPRNHCHGALSRSAASQLRRRHKRVAALSTRRNLTRISAAPTRWQRILRGKVRQGQGVCDSKASVSG